MTTSQVHKISPKLVLTAVIAVGAVYVIYKISSGAKAAIGTVVAGGKYVADKVNPISDTNIINTGVTEIGKKITGDSTFNLGKWIYNKTH